MKSTCVIFAPDGRIWQSDQVPVGKEQEVGLALLNIEIKGGVGYVQVPFYTERAGVFSEIDATVQPIQSIPFRCEGTYRIPEKKSDPRFNRNGVAVCPQCSSIYHTKTDYVHHPWCEWYKEEPAEAYKLWVDEAAEIKQNAWDQLREKLKKEKVSIPASNSLLDALTGPLPAGKTSAKNPKKKKN